MINDLNQMDKYQSDHLEMTPHAKWNVLSTLHEALKYFPTKPTLEHIYSNKDCIPNTKQNLIPT